MNVTDLVTNFGDVIELNNPNFDITKIQKILDESEYWVRYNPRKEISRFGLSITSLDGKYSGVPDLDSLREYNLLNNTDFKESSFKIKTPIVDELEIRLFLDLWGPFLNRSHFLRLDAGGFFPPHRDNGYVLPPNIMRIVVPIRWKKNQAIWIQNNQILDLREGTPYFINTSHEHSLFSYSNGTILMVLNVQANTETIQTIAKNAAIL